MNKLHLHVGYAVVVVALSAMLTNASAHAQSDPQRSTRQSRRSQIGDRGMPISSFVTAEQRLAMQHCTRFMRMNREILFRHMENLAAWYYQTVCENMGVIEIFSSIEATNAFRQCASFMSTQSERTHPVDICKNQQLMGVYTQLSTRQSFEQCVRYISRHAVPNMYPEPSELCVDERFTVIYSNQNDARAYEACTDHMYENTMIHRNNRSLSYCTEPSMILIFGTLALSNFYKTCMNFEFDVNRYRRSNWDCLERTRFYQTYVYNNADQEQNYSACRAVHDYNFCDGVTRGYHLYIQDRPIQKQAYNVCRAMGNSFASCIEGARQDYERAEQSSSQQNAAGAEE